MASRTISCACWNRAPVWTLLPLAFLPFSLQAQGNNVLSVRPSMDAVHLKRGEVKPLKLSLELRPGFHVNSNAPNDEYLIPLKLTWSKGSLEAGEIVYPEAQQEHYAFSQKPVSVFTGRFDIVTKVKVPADAPQGAATLTGKLRYQACNDKECLPPKTIDVQIPATID